MTRLAESATSRARRRLRATWTRIKQLDQMLLDAYATFRLWPPRRRKDTR